MPTRDEIIAELDRRKRGAPAPAKAAPSGPSPEAIRAELARRNAAPQAPQPNSTYDTMAASPQRSVVGQAPQWGGSFNPNSPEQPPSLWDTFTQQAERAAKSIGGMIGGQRPESEALAQFAGSVVTDPMNAANAAIEGLDPFHQAAYAYNDADAALKAAIAGDFNKAGNELKDLSTSGSFAAMSFLPGAEFAGATRRISRAAGNTRVSQNILAEASPKVAPEAVEPTNALAPKPPMFTAPAGPAPRKGNAIVRNADRIVGGALGATAGGTGDALAAPGDGGGDGGGPPTGAITGAAIGIFGPRALANAGSRGFRAAARTFSSPTARATFDERVAAKAVRDALKSSGIKSADEAAAQMAARYGDKPAAVADLTQEGVGTAAGLSRLPGRTGETAKARYEDLQLGKMGRLEGDLGAANPNLNPAAIAGDFDGMIKAAQEQAKPLYDGLRAKYKTIESPRLQYLSEVDAIAPFVRGVQEYRTALQQTTGREITDFEFWDLVKRDIDAKESGLAAKGVPKNDIRFQQIENARTSIVDELDTLMPEYAAAREMGGEAPKMRTAFGQGEKLLGGKASIEDVGRAVASVTGQPLTAMQAGVIRSIVGKIENTKGAVQALTSPGAAAKMEKVFGKEATDQIQARFRADAAMVENAGRINPNVGSVSSQAAMGGGGIGGMVANVVKAVRNPTEAGLSLLSKSGAYSKKQRDIMGEMLLEGATPENLQRIYRGKGGPTAPRPQGPLSESGSGNSVANAAGRTAAGAGAVTVSTINQADADTRDKMAQTREKMAQTRGDIETEKTSLAKLQADKEFFRTASPTAVQERLIRDGVNVGPRGVDGNIGKDTQAAITERQKQIDAEIEAARNRITGAEKTYQDLEREDAYLATRQADWVETAKEIGPNLALALGLGLGEGTRLLANKSVAQKVDKEIARLNNKLNSKPVVAPTGPKQERDLHTRYARINELWREGGAASNEVPFKTNNAGEWRGQKAPPASSLFKPKAPNFRGSDAKWMAAGALDGGYMTAVAIPAAEKELEEATKAVEDAPNKENYTRLENAKNMLAIYQGAQRFGGGLVAGRGIGAMAHPYKNVRPDIASADAERVDLLSQITKQRAAKQKVGPLAPRNALASVAQLPPAPAALPSPIGRGPPKP